MNYFKSTVIPVAVGLLFLFAGVSKLLHPGAAVLGLAALDVPPRWADYLVYGLVIVELYLGVLLALRLDLKWSLGGAMALLFCFTVYLWRLSSFADPPSCGCLGLTGVFESNRAEALFGMFRNVALILLIKWAYDYNARAEEREEKTSRMTGSLAADSARS